jgi:2-methylcitrate dehydratase PrpD
MCLPFSVALAAKVALAPRAGTTLSIEDYETGLADRDLFDIEERTAIALDDEVEAASTALSTAARVSVTLRDGRALSRLVRAPKGSAGDPFTAAEHEARFTGELSRRVPERVCAEIVGMSKDLDNLDPRRITRVLGEGGAG